jgi:hypothetical protein
MYWDHPEDDEAYNVPNQYHFGSELIAAPITQKRDSETLLGAAKVWLPAGKYVDIFTGLVYNRRGELTMHRPLNLTPVLAREGAIVPLDGAWRPKSGSPNPESLEILVVVGADGSFTLLEDDDTGTHVDDMGFSMVDLDAESDDSNVKFISTPIVYKHATGVLQIGPATPADTSVVPKSRDWKIRFIAYTSAHPDKITCLTTSPGKKHTAKSIFHSLSTESNGTVISVPAIPTSHGLIVNLGSSSPPQLDVIDPLPRLYELIDRGNSDLEQKRDVWNTVDNGDSTLNKVRNLQGKNLRGEFLDALLEVLVADERGEVGE